MVHVTTIVEVEVEVEVADVTDAGSPLLPRGARRAPVKGRRSLPPRGAVVLLRDGRGVLNVRQRRDPIIDGNEARPNAALDPVE